MLTSFFAKLTAFFMSIFLAIGAFFGVAQEPEQKPDDQRQIKNVIYLIGDGMGFNHLEKTKKERNVKLVMDTFELKGSSKTRSLSSSVTDSAAGGTALATGYRTGNGMIGVYFEDKHANISYPKNITELCAESGMMTGVITTDSTAGATPAAFSAHSSNRDNDEDITNDQLASDIDIIWGKSSGLVTESIAEANGFEYVATYADMMALEEGSRSFGQFTNSLWQTTQSNSKTPNLEQMAIKAVDLLDDTDEGFFLMIEGAHIDKHSHSNNSEDMTEALLEFDYTIEAMLEYAKADGETLVVITADHETGGIKLKDGAYVFTKDGHSSADVPVLVYGSDAIITNGENLNNYEIPKRIAYLLGFNKDQFPFEVKK